jgi:rubredoxin
MGDTHNNAFALRTAVESQPFKKRRVAHPALSRKTVWIKEENVMGWGCSECAWVFNPSGPPIGKTLDQMTRNFHAQLSEEFASHDCAEHPRFKRATPSS